MDDACGRPTLRPFAAAPAPAPQRGERAGAARQVQARDDVAVLLLVDLAPGARAWGWSRVVLGALPLRQVPGLRFAKALGSGHRGGFGLRPSLSRQGLFVVFEREGQADDFIQASSVVHAYRKHARELCIAKLRASSCRGSWGGESIAVTASVPAGAPVASLTRATIHAGKALDFWRRSPPAEAALERAEGCLLAVGLGEAPLLRQATFSVWKDQAAMNAYARSGAHEDALRAAQHAGWFSESMFVRFAPLQIDGTWQGRQHG